jgi:hypothetical protein
MNVIILNCQTVNCKGSYVIDRDQFGNTCLKCYLCERAIKREDFQHLIDQRNRHGYTDGGQPVKQGKQQYGFTRLKGR